MAQRKGILPQALTEAEMREVAELKDVREMWGAETPAEFIEFLETCVYAVKFNFESGSPGYCGDYILLQGDALMEESPVKLIRVDGKLKVCDFA